MLELLFLLLPLAAASGWYSARRARPAAAPKAPPGAYFKGLNLLLNEQPDKAVDHFLTMLEVDKDTVETHLALGSLFRRRGEVDRAIRIHQNLIARPTLDRDQRALALLALGQDYLKAGLYDRASGLFEELIERQLYQHQALNHLHQIYQRTKDWDKAMAIALRLEALGGFNLRLERAHYCCELANLALGRGDETSAENLLNKALATDKNTVRASLMLGNLAIRQGNYPAAIAHYRRLEAQDPAFLSEALLPLVDAYRHSQNDTALHDLLQGLASRYGCVEALRLLLDQPDTRQDEAGVQELLADFLQKYPSLKAMNYLLKGQPQAAKTSELIPQLEAIVEHLVKEEFPYLCQKCGFSSRQIYWQCPGCATWGSIRPIQLSALKGQPDGLVIE
jgi:lipopolysaccharide biosynthesis regulator YciM